MSTTDAISRGKMGEAVTCGSEVPRPSQKQMDSRALLPVRTYFQMLPSSCTCMPMIFAVPELTPIPKRPSSAFGTNGSGM